MTIEELQNIFKPQLDEGNSVLYFMLEENNKKLINRHSSQHLEELLPILESFQYDSTVGRMPLFKNTQGN